MIALQLPTDIEVRLSELAKTTGRSTNDYACNVLLEHISDIEGLRVAQERLEEIESGKVQPISLEAMKARYALDN